MSTPGLSVAEIGALLGDPGRANILAALLDGRALTAGELGWVAGVSPPTTSGHLARLIDGRLLTVERQGRHRHHRLATAEVARMLEGVLVVAAQAPARRRATPRISPALRDARTCYDHLAGRLGVGLADALVDWGDIVLSSESAAVTARGQIFLEEFGVTLQRKPGRRLFCRPCLDWSERRPHLAGLLGAALCARCVELGWVRRRHDTRAVEITEAGRRGFAERFRIAL